MMTQEKLFKVYFKTVVGGHYIPAASYKYLWAASKEQAQIQLDEYVATYRDYLEPIGFMPIDIEEVQLEMLSDWMQRTVTPD